MNGKFQQIDFVSGAKKKQRDETFQSNYCFASDKESAEKKTITLPGIF